MAMKLVPKYVCQCYPHIETSQLIYCANQLTGFYMRATLALNGLNTLPQNLGLKKAYVKEEVYINNPLDTGRKLNVQKTFRRSPGRLLNVLCTFNLCPVSRGNRLKLRCISIQNHSFLSNLFWFYFWQLFLSAFWYDDHFKGEIQIILS